MHPSVHLSVTLSPPKPLGGIQPNLLHHFPSCKVREQHYFSICPPSICPSRYLLLNHRAEFNQTCYITSPHGKVVQEQHYFSVFPSVLPLSVDLSIILYLLLNRWVEFNQTCYITSPYGKGVQEQHCFFVPPSSIHPSVCHTISS